ncbi:hypothetical protein JZU57_01515, partial [bacterium]|nr:hypothetical protein [bacterium]
MANSMHNLICINQSSVTGSFCLYETGGVANIGAAWPLAWIVERVPGGGRAWLRWTDEDGVAWGRTGPLAVGAIFFATQVQPVSSPGAVQLNLLPGDGVW